MVSCAHFVVCGAGDDWARGVAKQGGAMKDQDQQLRSGALLGCAVRVGQTAEGAARGGREPSESSLISNLGEASRELQDAPSEPAECGDGMLRRRSRCPALRSQTAGQGPELPAGCTTVVVRNLPRNYTPDMVAALLQGRRREPEHPIDFLYVPFDPKVPGRNVGFAIVNFRMSEALMAFAAEFHHAPSCEVFPGCRSRKVCEIVPAPLQGKERNLCKLASCPMLAGPEWLPRVFDEAGCAATVKPPRTRSGSPPGQRTPTFVGA
mmetsp:Transcript_67298/g.173274  ORF Transcript_67298/g.173274 Transcript_67298/m.173274 type:complete len:265 (+) Transcript_67298:128-922(+)